MAFAEYVMNNKKRVFDLAKENAKGETVSKTLYEEWKKSKDDDMMNFYR